MRNFISVIMAIMFSFIIIHPHTALAECLVTGHNGESIPIDNAVDIPEITVPSGSPVGTRLYYGETTQQSRVDYSYTHCSKIYTNALVGVDSGIETPEGCHIFTTNIRGIGYAFSGGDFSNDHCSRLSPPGAWPTGSSSYYSLDSHIGIYVIGQTESGMLASGEYVEVLLDSVLSYRVFINGGSVKSISCNVSSTNISVPMGDVAIDKFTSPGFTTDAKNFDVGLTCDGNANVSVNIDATQDTETTDQSVIALTGAGESTVATGVGVQLLYNNAPMEIGKDVSLQAATASTLTTYPFQARYYQTKGTVTPGDANATATLNLTYQ